MIVERFITIIVEIFFLILLSFRYIKRYAPENLVIIPVVAVCIGSYISFTVNNAYIPLYIQICIFIFSFVLPAISIILQYNNIIITRKILYYRMKYSFFSKEYSKTIGYITKLVSYEGRKAEYLYILGICYKNLNDFINARDSFALAIDLDKNDYKSYYELGLILDETNKKDTAIVMFNKCIKIKSDFYEAKEALGICYTSQGKFKEAVNVYKKALEKHPDSYEMYYNIAIIELEVGEYEEAKAAFKKAGKMLNSGVYGPKAYYKIAVIYALKKEYEKSMASLEYAIELDPKYIKKVREEYAFVNMKNMIDKYLIDKEILENKEKQRRNYMKDRFKLFKKKELEEDYSKDYSTNSYGVYDKVKHA